MMTQVNQSVVDRFRRLIKANRMGHAYLFVGPSDAGKTQTALAIAQLVNCESDNGPCGSCGSCVRISLGNHPDITVTNPDEKNSIKIEAIRQLLERFRLRAFEARTKVFVICNVEWLEREAANAFLKTLEEPAPNTLIILTTAVPEANLDTIKSRCHQVNFFPTSANRIAQALKAEGFDDNVSSFLAVYADGCLGKAKKLAEDGIGQRKNRVLDQMLSHSMDDVIKELSTDKYAAIEALNVLLSFCRDAMLIKHGISEAKMVHKDRMADLKQFSSRSIEDLAAIINQIVRSRKLIDDNLNVKMSLTLLRERIWVK